MPSLVATTSALARKPCVSTHYVRTNNAKFSGHYFCPRTHNVRAHALRSHQKLALGNIPGNQASQENVAIESNCRTAETLWLLVISYGNTKHLRLQTRPGLPFVALHPTVSI